MPKVFVISIVTPPVSPKPGVSQTMIYHELPIITSKELMNLVSDLFSNPILKFRSAFKLQFMDYC